MFISKGCRQLATGFPNTFQLANHSNSNHLTLEELAL